MSECGENLTPGLDGDDVTKRIQITGRVDDLRTRIAAVLRSALLEVDYSDAQKSADGEQWVFIDGTVIPENLADAVIREMTIWIPPIVASAIHSWADSELAAISHHGTEGEYEMLKRLNQEAAQIANYATTHERWNGSVNGER